MSDVPAGVTRHIHCHSRVLGASDYETTPGLLGKLIVSLDGETVAKLT